MMNILKLGGNLEWSWSNNRSISSAEHDRLKALEREDKELKNANEILRKASAFF